MSFMRRTALFLIIAGSLSLYAQTRIIPHVTRAGGGFTTTVIIENTTVDTADYTLQPYDASGNLLDAVTGSLAGQATQTFDAAELLSADASHFLIEGDILVNVAYTTVNEGGSPAQVRESGEQASSYRLLAGDWSVVFDGFAVVNTGTVDTPVWVAQRSTTGDIIKSVRVSENLAPNAKSLFIIGDPNGSEFEHQPGYTYEVYGNQALAITALRSNIPGSNFLWVNQAEPKSGSSTTRDEQAIWFIEGGSSYDVAEMMGYNVASDRLWQMEAFLRASQGRISEIPALANDESIESDILARTINYSEEEYQQGFLDLDPEARAMVKGYADGVNRRIAETLADLSIMPIEFLVLEFFPQPWDTTDILSMTTFLLRNFDPMDFGSGQLANAAMLQQLQTDYPETGSIMFNDLRWLNDPDAVTVIPGAATAKNAANAGPLAPTLRNDIDFTSLYQQITGSFQARERHLESLNAKPKMGSYAWVISGDHTLDNNPMIYSGPQMGFDAPAIVVEGSIRGGGLDISGMTVPGIPGIIIGRTPHHAWSMQVGHAHTSDLYIEAPSALTTPHRTETVNVGGGDPIQVDIYRTEHGPVLSQAPIVAWKYSHWGKEFGALQAFLDLARAQSMDEVGEALERVPVSQHFCYADRDGNIAYWMTGHNPVRPEGEYRFPQGSFPGAPILEYDINDYLPLSHDRNTDRGYYGGWNNKTSSDYNNAPFGAFQTYGVYHRANVVEDALAAMVNEGGVIFEQVRDLAIDIAATHGILNTNSAWPFSPGDPGSAGSGGGNPWPLLSDAFGVAVANNTNADRQAAIEIMDNWDGHFIDGGELRWINGTDRADGWVLMDTWIRRVAELTFEEVDGRIGRDPIVSALTHLLADTSLEKGYDWFTNADDTAPQTGEAIIVQALDDALTALGPRPWGVEGRGTIDHINPLFLTLLGTPIHQTPFSSRSTYAHCVEYGPDGPVRIESMFPLGQSGNAYQGGLLGFEFDPNALSMNQFFDNWIMRSFPLFD